jgi:hypothetical protein
LKPEGERTRGKSHVIISEPGRDASRSFVACKSRRVQSNDAPPFPSFYMRLPLSMLYSLCTISSPYEHDYRHLVHLITFGSPLLLSDVSTCRVFKAHRLSLIHAFLLGQILIVPNTNMHSRVGTGFADVWCILRHNALTIG